MRITKNNILYALSHPWRTLRYVQNGDNIPYETIRKYLPESPVILEAGAHNGFNSVEMVSAWPSATVHAFEPVPAAYEELVARAKAFPNRILCNQAGLGPKAGKMDLNLSGDGSAGSCQSSSLLPPTSQNAQEYSFLNFEKTISVEVTTIDDWAAANNVDRLDFLWLDMQGYELECLKGAKKMLPLVKAIHLEVSNIQLYEGAPLYPEVKSWLAQHGFKPVFEAVFRVGGNVLFAKI
jgi:FkbM family methyltransferase